MKKVTVLFSLGAMVLLIAAGYGRAKERAAADAALVAEIEEYALPRIQAFLECYSQHLGEFTSFSGTYFKRIDVFGNYQIHLRRTAHFEHATFPVSIVVREGRGMTMDPLNEHNFRQHVLGGDSITNATFLVDVEAPLRNKFFP